MEPRRCASSVLDEHAIQNEIVGMDVEPEVASSAMDCRDGPAVSLVLALQAKELLGHTALPVENRVNSYPDNLRAELGIVGQKKSQRRRIGQRPLANRNLGDYVVNQEGSAGRHSPSSAGGVQPALARDASRTPAWRAASVATVSRACRAATE